MNKEKPSLKDIKIKAEARLKKYNAERDNSEHKRGKVLEKDR